MKTGEDQQEKFPFTRFDPGELPEPPEHLNEKGTAWFWRLCAWCKVRTAIHAHVEDVEEVADLLGRFEEMTDDNQQKALKNIEMILTEKIGFSKVDLKHLEIPI